MNLLSFEQRIGVGAIPLVAWHLEGVGWQAHQARHDGAKTITVNAWITSAFLGIAIALAGGFGDGILAHHLVGVRLPPAGNLVVQIVGALAGSTLTAHLYSHVLNEPVRTWVYHARRTPASYSIHRLPGYFQGGRWFI